MWITVLLVVAILAALIFIDAKKPRKYPPGPPWLPIVGSLPYIAIKCHKGKKELSETLSNIAKEYGSPILGIKVGKDNMVVLCDYECIKEVLTRDEFDGRPTGPFFETRTWGSRKGVIVVDGPFWQEQRRFMLRHLKDFGFARRSMEEIIKREVSELKKYLIKKVTTEEAKTPDSEVVRMTLEADPQQEEQDKNPDEPIIWLHNAFGRSVLNTIWSMTAGVRYEPEDTELRDLQDILGQLFKIIHATGCPFSHFPFLRYIAPEMSGYKQFLNTHQKIWDFLHRELVRHKATYQSGQQRDLMDVYIAKMEADVKEGIMNSNFDDTQLLATCMDLFMAGSETTANSLALTFYYLVTNEHIQKKIQEEIDSVVEKDRMPTLEDRPRMPYAEATVTEALRLFAGHSFGLAHRALKDSWLQGYFIPKDTMLVTCYSSILLSEEHWDEPKAFRPERFIDTEGKFCAPNIMIPFGIGKRRCVGDVLAKANIFLFVTGLLQEYEFKVPEGDTPSIDKDLVHSGITPSVGPFRAIIKLRR